MAPAAAAASADSGTCPAAKGRCGACVQLNWTCSLYCVFSKCFPANRPNKFAVIRRVYRTESVWQWLALMPPDRRMEATEYLAIEASNRLRWLAKNNPGYRHPPDQGMLIYPDIREYEGAWRLGTACDAIRVTIPPFGNQYYPGESSGVNGNGN